MITQRVETKKKKTDRRLDDKCDGKMHENKRVSAEDSAENQPATKNETL